MKTILAVVLCLAGGSAMAQVDPHQALHDWFRDVDARQVEQQRHDDMRDLIRLQEKQVRLLEEQRRRDR
jgi:hypothetical protein